MKGNKKKAKKLKQTLQLDKKRKRKQIKRTINKKIKNKKTQKEKEKVLKNGRKMNSSNPIHMP